jgi:RNA polymerase sigma-70 factor, ECF subfamily
MNQTTDSDDGLEGLDDRELVEMARHGDLAGFEALYARHNGLLYRTALAVTRDRAPAEELLQEAFLRAYRNLARISLEPGASLRPWLHRIVINLAYDWAARRRNRSTGSLDAVMELVAAPANLSPERYAERREQAALIDAAVAALSFKHRIVVILYYLHDMDLTEIATVLNVPEGTIKSRLYYGRAKLRDALETDRRVNRQGTVVYAPAARPLA